MVDGKKYRNIKVEKLRRAAVEWFRLNLAELWDSSSSMLRIEIEEPQENMLDNDGLDDDEKKSRIIVQTFIVQLTQNQTQHTIS